MAKPTAPGKIHDMVLSLRPTGLSSPAFADWADYCVIEDGKIIGRIYEDRHTLPVLRWFWSITEHVDPALPIDRNGRAPSLADAKARFRASWSKWRAASKQKEQQRP
jgi:hypothetical protein